MCASPVALLVACAELLENFKTFAALRPRARLWHELLTQLAGKTLAKGGCLELATVPADGPPVGYLTTLHVGDMDDASLAWAKAATAELLQDGKEWALRESEAGNSVCAALPVSPDRPAISLCLEYSPTSALTPENGMLLAAVLRAAAAFARQEEAREQTADQLARFQELYEVGQSITSTLDLEQVLRQSTARVAEVLGAEASTLLLVDEANQQLVFKIPAGPAEHLLLEQRMPIDKGLAGWVATRGESLIIEDVQSDDRFYMEIDRLTGYQTHSIMAVPLRVQGKIIGVAEVINKLGGTAFSPRDLQWLSTLAPLIAVAIDNARLFAEVREESDRIIAAEEKVRHELARNLHDGPAQITAALILNIDMARRQLAAKPEKMAKELNFLESQAQEANQEVRDLLFNLRPLSLEAHGLEAALVQLVERVQAHAGFELHLEIAPKAADGLDSKAAGTLFVIVQEALNNIQKHARAQNVWVRLGRTHTQLWVAIADDGMGFDVHEVDTHYAQLGNFGLLNMRERARLINGRTRIESPRPDAATGTLVQVQVPLSRVLQNKSGPEGALT